MRSKNRFPTSSGPVVRLQLFILTCYDQNNEDILGSWFTLYVVPSHLSIHDSSCMFSSLLPTVPTGIISHLNLPKRNKTLLLSGSLLHTYTIYLLLLDPITSSDWIKLSVCPPEIPLFHVLNARVTFSNLCGCDEPVSSVTVHKPEGSEETGNNPFTHTQVIKITLND